MIASAHTVREVTLLNEIRGLATRIRGLRTDDARLNGAEIKSLEEQSRANWGQLRRSRADPAEVDGTPARRSLYR